VWCSRRVFAINWCLRRFHRHLTSWQRFENVISKTPQRNACSISERELKDRQTEYRECWAVVVAASLHLPRRRNVVRKLKITSSGAVPFGYGEVVLIDGI